MNQTTEVECKSLHEAVVQGNEKAVQDFIIKKHADVNEKDNNGNTPLLLAICIKNENIYNSIVQILIENEAEVNTFNKGVTPLYNAVFHHREESVKMLLKRGAWLSPDSTNQYYVLHLLVSQGRAKLLKLLLDYEQRYDQKIFYSPEEGQNLAYLAIEYGYKDCLRILIKHGYDLSCIVAEKQTVLDCIFEDFSNPVKFLVNILNSCVSLEKVEGKNLYFIDFSILTSKKCNEQIRQMDVISSLLVAANDEERTELLQHPVIELFLIRKWFKVRQFFYLWLCIYFLFASSMSVYVTLLVHNDDDFYILKWVSRSVLAVTAVCLLGHGVLQCVLTHRKHFRKYEMWMNVVCTSLSFTVAVAVNQPLNEANIQDMSNWFLNVTSIAVLLAWLELMLLIGRLPTYGYYALMFSTVLQNVIKVLLAFMCLIIGFALSFSIQFYSYEQFTTPWRALVKTTVMMMGEFEYADLFAETSNDLQARPTVSRVMFLMFIILTSVVLMNLMIGLAVSDIQTLQKQSHARKLEKQAEFLCQFEKVIYSKHLNTKYIPTFIKQFCKRKSFICTKYELKTSAKFRRSKTLSRGLIDSFVCIAKGRKEIENSTLIT